MRNDTKRLENVVEVASERTESMLRIMPTQILVKRDKLVSMKENIGIGKAEGVRLGGHTRLPKNIMMD